MPYAGFRRWVVGAAVVYAIVLAALLPDLSRHGATLRTPGWKYAVAGTPSRVTSVDPRGPAAGILEVGDRILSIDGETQYVNQYRPDWQVWSYAPGRSYHVRFERAGQVREAALRIVTQPSDKYVLLICIFVFGSLIYQATALLIGWQRPDLRTARLGWMAAQLTAFVYLSVAMSQLGPLGWIVTPLSCIPRLADRWNIWFAYCFLAEFPFAIPESRFWRGLRRGLFAVCAASWVLYTVWHLSFVILPFNPHIWRLYPTWWLSSEGFVSSVCVASVGIALLAVLVRNYRAIRDPGARRRIEIVAGACVIGVVADAAVFIENSVTRQNLPWGNLAPLVIPICFAYAVMKHKVLDLRLVIRRSVQHLLARQVLRGLTLLPLVVLAVRAVRDPAAPIGSLANLAGIAWIAAAALLLAFRERILAAVDRWFFRETLDREKLVRGLLVEIGRAESWSAVVDHALPRLAAIFSAESAALADYEVAGECFRIRALGFLVMGPKRSEEPYTASERELLDLVASQMGLVRDNLALAAGRQDAVTSERNRIAREVHDTAGHGFAGISLYLEAARKTLAKSPDQAREYLEQAGAIARQSLQETRQSVAAMRGESDLELRLRALERAAGAGPAITVELEEGVCRAASPDVQWHLARIAEEAVTNARKHSSASKIRIELKSEGPRILLRVRDDGGGFDPALAAGRGYGLVGMRERAGELRGTIDILTAPGKGTEVCAAVAAGGGA